MCEGSGWSVDSIIELDILNNYYQAIPGSSYIPLPKHIASKKAFDDRM